jgi:heptosyltransferase-1
MASRFSPIAADARILLVRLSAIGDIVFASSVISAFRRGCPKAHIAWLVQPECAPLLDRHTDLDEVVICPVKEWQRLLRERRLRELARGIAALRRTLREGRFDLAVDMQGLLKSGLLTHLSGARERIGLGSKEGSRLLLTHVLPRGRESKRIGSEYLFLAESLGLPTEPFEMAVRYDAEDAAVAAGVVERDGLDGGYAVICPFTTRPQKHWFEDRWGQLAARLKTDLGLTPVLLGGPGDQEAARRIAQRIECPHADLAGRTTLREAAALIDRASLLVAVDTGLGHMGIALNTPSVLLFGSTCPYLDTTRSNALVLYHALRCSPCKRRPTCNGAFTCMREVDVTEVMDAARRVIAVQ